MQAAFTRMVNALRRIAAGLVRLAELASERPWWTEAPRSVQFARARQLSRVHPARGPTPALRWRLHQHHR